MKTKIAAVAGLAVSLAAARSVLSHYAVPIPNLVIATVLWIAIAALLAYAAIARSLTVWILASMVVGGVVGHSWPGMASHLQVLSQIFLRLIKVIVAPLLFATLVSGIAGHSDLKKVGRMGIKSIVYFEVVTTLALFIGLAAINISKAGVGVKLGASTAAA